MSKRNTGVVKRESRSTAGSGYLNFFFTLYSEFKFNIHSVLRIGKLLYGFTMSLALEFDMFAPIAIFAVNK